MVFLRRDRQQTSQIRHLYPSNPNSTYSIIPENQAVRSKSSHNFRHIRLGWILPARKQETKIGFEAEEDPHL